MKFLMMKQLKYVGLLLAACLLLACSDLNNKPLTAADLQGKYKFELSQAGEGNKPSRVGQEQDSLFTIGPDYIAFGQDRQPVDRMTVQDVTGEKYLVLTVKDKDMRLKIIDKDTLTLQNRRALGTFSRIR